MSMRMPWFRMYVDFLNDPKLIRLAFEDQRHFIGVLALKSDGALDGDADPELLNRIVAQRLWIDHAVIREVKKRLVSAGLITEEWQPIAWVRRQFKSDSSKDRVARFRAKKKGGNEDGDDAGNDDETLQKRSGNAVDTDTDTDTDTDKEEEIPTAVDQRGEVETAAPAATPKRKRADPTATRLPAGWVLPKAWGDWAMQERPDLSAEDVRREAECFADYWHAKAGADARKADWLATWRNWVRRANGGPAAGVGRGGPPRPPSPASDTPTETYAQRAARQRMEEVAPMAARRAPGASFDAAQRFMHGEVIDATPANTQLPGA